MTPEEILAGRVFEMNFCLQSSPICLLSAWRVIDHSLLLALSVLILCHLFGTQFGKLKSDLSFV